MKRLLCAILCGNIVVYAMEEAVIKIPVKKKKSGKKSESISFDPKTQEYKISKKILDNYFMQQNQLLEDNLMPQLAPKVKASKLSDSDADEIDFDDALVYEEINKIVIEALQDAFTDRQKQVNDLSQAMNGKWDRKQVVLVSSIVGGIATILSSAVALIINFTGK